MKLITAYIQPSRLELVSAQLVAANIVDMTITTCCGHGRDCVLVPSFRGGPDAPDLLPTLMLEVIVPERKAQQAVEAIVGGARTGSCGDGKVIITTLELVVRIGTGGPVMDAPAIEHAKIRRIRPMVHHSAL